MFIMFAFYDYYIEFQVAGAEQRNARLANVVLANGSDNRVVVVEHRVRTLSRSLM